MIAPQCASHRGEVMDNLSKKGRPDLAFSTDRRWLHSKSGKTGRSRNRDYEGLEAHIHRVLNRAAHGISTGRGGVCERGRNRTEVTALNIGDGSCRIRADRRLHGRAAGAIFDGELQASNKEETDAQGKRTNEHGDEDGRDDRELNRRSPSLIDAKRPQMMAHDQPNLIMAVLLIGVAKVLATLRPGNSGT
jgi:hypothetical protein